MVDGEQWERLADAARLLGSRPPSTVRAWAMAGRVRTARLAGGEVFVAMADVLDVDAQVSRRRRRRAGARGVDR